MKYLFLTIFLLASSLLKAQISDSAKVIRLHPALGKVITPDEKKQYSLFPEYKNNLFQSAEVLKYNDSTYTIRFCTTKGGKFERPTDTKELDAIYNKIESQTIPNIAKEQRNNRREDVPERRGVDIDPIDALNLAFIISRIAFAVLIITMH